MILMKQSVRSLGIGESVRGLAIDIADLGHELESGKTIAADGKAEEKEGVKLVEDGGIVKWPIRLIYARYAFSFD